MRDAATGRPHWIATRNVSLDASRRICATLPVVDRDGRFVRVRLPDGAEIWVRMIEDRVKYTGEAG